jgi:Uma2 family endonuclease
MQLEVTRGGQRVILRDVSWDAYESLLESRGDASYPRLTYLDGSLELMSPSDGHDGVSSMLHRLLTVYALERGIDLDAFGSWTVRKKSRRGGLEPDECFVLGDKRKSRPDLAIEVVRSHGGLDKLEIYRRLEVREVWFWIGDRLVIHVLRGARYHVSSSSVVLPDLDVQQMVGFVTERQQMRALRAYRAALRRR